MTVPPLLLGVDVGTSGLRLVLMDATGCLHHQSSCSYPGLFVEPLAWQQGIIHLCQAIPGELRGSVTGLAVAGTSGTLVAVNQNGEPLGCALAYHEAQPRWGSRCRQLADPHHPAASANSTLARALTLLERHPEARGLRHQAEWLVGWLLDDWRWGDAHNSLKLGWDPLLGRWSGCIAQEWWFPLLPEVVAPGTVLGRIRPAVAATLKLPTSLRVVAGTTDGNAAVLAVNPRLGDGVTVLGTTLVLKQLCPTPLHGPGLYNHPLDGQWLAGGASNSGAGVLRHFFNDDALASLSRQIDPQQSSGLSYRPLLGVGERFPVDDPTLTPQLEPRPVSDALFLQGLLEGIATIEAEGWKQLQTCGAPPLQRVITVGGGARNPIWRRIREAAIGRPVLNRPSVPLACGAARLARRVLCTEA